MLSGYTLEQTKKFWADNFGAARHVRSQLADGGTWMVVEPFAGDSVEENLNPVGRVFYAGSTMLCTPASLSRRAAMLSSQPASAGVMNR